MLVFSNNLKVWQSKKDNLWRYLLWDIDWGYGLWDSISPSGSPKWNALAFQLSDNAGWTKTSETQLFQHAMKNDDFKNLFITRSFDYLNFECSEENHLKVIQNLTKTIENNLDQQFQLYKGNFSSWQNELAKIENYVHQRHQHHSIHLAQFIQDSLVELNLTQNHRSTILINGKQLNNEELIYPSNCKLHLLPLRKDEESFLMWSDSITLLSRWVTAKGSLPYPLYTASKNEDQLVISEVNTAPNYSSRKEHLEISNSSNLPVLLYGYSISDGNNTQHFQIDDFIEPQSTKRFDYLEFNLNKNGEELVLRNAKGKLVDAWDYSFEAFTRTNHDYLYFKENNNQQFILSKETMAWMLNWSSEEITLYTLQGKKTTEPLAGHYFIRRNNQLVAIRILD
ncbi:MAG: CotH kinase family protein [Flavobacteriales bacterium]